MEKKNANKNSQKRSKDKKILSLLKKTGYLAPTSKKEVEDFETYFGNTPIDIPQDIDNPNFIFEQDQNIDSIEKGSKVVSISSNNSVRSNDYFKKLVLSAEIVNQLYNEPTFGHKKFVKVQYLCEEICNMELSTNYQKYAAGPLDPKHMYSVDAEFKKRKWFNVTKRKGSYGYRYYPDEKIEEYKKYYPKYFSDKIDMINHIIELFRKEDSNFCEIVATMFYVWKLELQKNSLISDELLILQFYAWGEEKIKFSPIRLKNSIEWMKNQQIVPLR